MKSEKSNSLQSTNVRARGTGIEDNNGDEVVSGKRKRTSNQLNGMKIGGSEVANEKVIRKQELKIFNEEESRRELARMVILHNYPLGIVEDVGFRRFSASLQPSFNMISRNTLKKDIMKMHVNGRIERYISLNKLKCRIAITIDMWASDNNKSFMAVSAHYIDDSWFMYVPAPHTAEALSEHLVEALMARYVNRKLSTITVANCMSNDAMMTGVLEKLPKEEMLLDGKVLHMHCFAHLLNSIAKDALEVINGATERIRDNVIYWTDTPDRIVTFKDNAYMLNIWSTKKLSLDCETRWESTYLMLEAAIVYKDVFPKVQLSEEHYKDLPSDKDWMDVTAICGMLKCFYQVAEKFSKNLYPTANFYLQNICSIKLKLNEWVKSSDGMIKDMGGVMLEKYDKYLDNCLIMVGVASVLDPRYKLKLIEFFFLRVYGEEAQSKIDQVRHNCYDLLSDYMSRDAKISGDGLSTKGIPGSMMSCGKPGVTDASAVDDLEKFDEFVASTAKASLTYELDVYLKENVLPRIQDFDVLGWWKTEGAKYPNLQSMARDILAIRISAFGSFSTGGRRLSPHLSRLNPSTVEALMCTHGWLWKEENGACSTFGDPSTCPSNPSTCPSMLDEEEEEED